MEHNDVLPCLGSVLLSRFSLNLKGSLLFSGNTQSALCLTASSIELLPSTQLQFISNRGFNGAALHVVDCSSVIVNDGTSLYFRDNIASNHGGALYSEACTQTRGDCFIRHSNSTLDPDQWKTDVTFDILGNSIYVDSIQSCVWPKYNKNTTFCWRGWFFVERDSCLDQLSSGPAYITNNGTAKHTLYPGECINLQDFSVFDDWGKDITNQTILQVSVLSGAARVISYGPDCTCINPVAPDTCFDDSSTLRICKPGEVEVTILSHYENNYTSHDSQILIHPPNQPYGIVLDLSFKTCDNYGALHVNTSDHSGFCKPFVLYEAVCTKYYCIGEKVWKLCYRW